MALTMILAGVLAATLICIFAIRARSTPVRLAAEVLMLAAIEACLWESGTGPLPTQSLLAQSPNGAWLRVLAAIWWLIAARMIATLAVLALGRDARSRQARLFSDLLAGAIYVTTALIILNSVLDLPVKGLLATSGVIAIVLGLALQSTLADVFSGIVVGIEKPFNVGDRITIRDYAEGLVVEMTWRSIRLQTDSEDLATIPNSIVARSQIINRSVPTRRRAASVEIPTHSTARSETLMGLINQAILLCPAVLRDPAPKVTLKHVGTRITTFGIAYMVEDTPALGLAKSQLLRQVRRLFHHAGIPDGKRAGFAEILHGLVLFESLSEEQIAMLVPSLVPHRLHPGAVMFAQGSIGASLYIVRAGVFEITRHEDCGDRTLYGRIGPGEYLGEISMMTGEARTVTVTALTSGEVLELPRSAIMGLLGKDQALGAALEASVQRGLALLDRDEAARSCEPLDGNGSLLARIRSFLGRRAV